MQNRQEKFQELRRQFPVFAYDSFSYSVNREEIRIRFLFSIRNAENRETFRFEPELRIPNRPFYHPERIPESLWKNLVFHCGLVELVSYWKCCCCPKVEIRCGTLSSSQKQWFKKLYFNGLGEFFFLNGITCTSENFLDISCTETDRETESGTGEKTAGKGPADGDKPAFPAQGETRCEPGLPMRDAFLIPVGGGKDSVVTLEILREAYPERIRPFIINPRGATANCCTQAGFGTEECAVVNRSIHPLLLELNAQGFLNGHTPFSAMLAFTSLLVSALCGYRHIALSNENSANESTIIGQGVNHQYSKSLEFENDFRAYVSAHIGSRFNYFSFLRPLSELGIARLFASYPLYHDIFRSCNAGSKTDAWCGNCPKCLFAFIILCPFIGLEKCSRLFGKNLLDDENLKPYLDQLCGQENVKPFECVGTLDEVNWALQKLLPLARGNRLLEYYSGLKRSRLPQPDSLLEDLSSEHNLSRELLDLLKGRIATVKTFQTASFLVENPLPPKLRNRLLPFFLVPGPIALLGLGREGLSSYRLVRKLLPEKELIIVDAREEVGRNPLLEKDTHLTSILGTDYLERFAQTAKETGLILKSPGISLKEYPDLLELPQLSSQTDIFLKVFQKQIIGITGTKGKSTTTLLTYHLINAFRPCVLAGNMGIPFFDILDEIGPETCIVCEFSAHQLEQARRPPRIGLLLNLFEEHLDHYRSFLDYQKAKLNLAAPDQETFEKGESVFFYNQDDPLVVKRLKERFPRYFPREFPLGKEDAPSNRNPFRITGNPDGGPERFWGFSPHNRFGPHIENRRILDENGQEVFDLRKPHPLIGTHNENNLLAALAAAHAWIPDYSRLASRIASFKPLPHRLEYIGCFEGKHFFNDSISTIPQACIAAVESIESLPYVKGIDCLILGGTDRGIDYSPLSEFFRHHNVKSIIFAGAAGKRIFKLLQASEALPGEYLLSDSYPELVAWAKKHTRTGYACLLSPAAASYDQFRNFAHRGDVFTRLVKDDNV